jgi:serine/threonine protein kinase
MSRLPIQPSWFAPARDEHADSSSRSAVRSHEANDRFAESGDLADAARRSHDEARPDAFERPQNQGSARYQARFAGSVSRSESVGPLANEHDNFEWTMKRRAGDVLNGKYEVERQLAKGGMGSVWLALDLKLRRHVAVKFIEIVPADVSDATSIRLRFEREALAVARLSTPHVVQIFDHALDSQTPYIVMECLEGEDLKQRLAREQRLTFPAAVAIMNQAARGLRAAHEAGIVHRDLKPANIFLAEVDHEQVVKILDFGIAKLLDHRAVTVDGEIFGSARYMSPEQITGAKDLDLRSDLWSMGVILYRAITGSDPFSGDIVKTMQSLRLGDYPLATSVAPDLVPEVDAFFARALAVDKRRRFFSAVEMAEAFADLAEQQIAQTGVPIGSSEPTSRSSVFHKIPPPPPLQTPQTTRVESALSPILPGQTTDRIPASGGQIATDRIPPSGDGTVTDPLSPIDGPHRDNDPRLSPASRDPETLSVTKRETAASRRTRLSWIALAVFALAFAVFALRSRSGAVVVETPPAPPPPAAAAAPPPADATEPESTETPPPVASNESAEGDDAPAPSAAPEVRVHRSGPSDPPSPSAAERPRRAGKPNCNPPFYVDAQGARHAIKACL